MRSRCSTSVLAESFGAAGASAWVARTAAGGDCGRPSARSHVKPVEAVPICALAPAAAIAESYMVAAHALQRAVGRGPSSSTSSPPSARRFAAAARAFSISFSAGRDFTRTVKIETRDTRGARHRARGTQPLATRGARTPACCRAGTRAGDRERVRATGCQSATRQVGFQVLAAVHRAPACPRSTSRRRARRRGQRPGSAPRPGHRPGVATAGPASSPGGEALLDHAAPGFGVVAPFGVRNNAVQASRSAAVVAANSRRFRPRLAPGSRASEATVSEHRAEAV